MHSRRSGRKRAPRRHRLRPESDESCTPDPERLGRSPRSLPVAPPAQSTLCRRLIFSRSSLPPVPWHIQCAASTLAPIWLHFGLRRAKASSTGIPRSISDSARYAGVHEATRCNASRAATNFCSTMIAKPLRVAATMARACSALRSLRCAASAAKVSTSAAKASSGGTFSSVVKVKQQPRFASCYAAHSERET